jgi:hypothetical protein
MNSDGTRADVSAEDPPMAQQKLGRTLSAKEHAFITARGGFLALEAIRDTVTAATLSELEAYLNTG